MKQSPRLPLVLILYLGFSATVLHAQRLPTWPQPMLEHHEGTTVLVAGAAVGGIIGLSAAVNIKSGDTGLQKAGVYAFTLPAAALLGLGAAIVTETGTIAAVGFIAGGIMGGAVGRRAGTEGNKTSITAMGILSLASAVAITLGIAAE